MEGATTANSSPSPDSAQEQPSQQTPSPPRIFTLFPNLPPELRAPIWKHALPRRIIKWTRTSNINTFSAPKNSTPLFAVCKESREAAMLYGEYISLSNSSSSSSSNTPVYFSPILDHLLFEPIWTSLLPKPGSPPISDPLDSLPAQLLTAVRKIMVHPHYTDERKRPSAQFEKLVQLEQILVAADEKSIGFQSKFILGTVYDIKLYYAADVQKRTRVQARVPEEGRREVRTPYIAVGCLGWTGEERRKMHHGEQDARELVAVFENEAQMKLHLAGVREEEWRFTQEMRLGRPVLKLNFRKGEGREDRKSERVNGGRIERKVEGRKVDGGGALEPPSYSLGMGIEPERPPPYVETEEAGEGMD